MRENGTGGDEEKIAGLTPREWEKRLEEAASDPGKLAALLSGLEQEIGKEHSFLHDDPEPDSLLEMILEFFGVPEDNDYEQLGVRIEAELARERWLKERYRSWLPGEDVLDRIFPYIKDFGGQVREVTDGLRFPGFLKYSGLRLGRTREIYTLFLSERFPGREPANFHLLFKPDDGALVIKRVYRMELPRLEGPQTAARAVLAEMTGAIVPSPWQVRVFVVDNAANVETRKALIVSGTEGSKTFFALREGADPAATPLGNLMVKLAGELGYVPGDFRCGICPFGLLKIELAVTRRG